MKLSKYKFLLLLLFLVSFFLFIFFDSKQSILIEKDSSFDQINTQFQSNFGITFLKQGVFETNGNELILSEEMSVGSIQKKLERHFGCSFIAYECVDGKAKGTIDHEKTLTKHLSTFSGEKARYFYRAVFLGSSMFIFWILEVLPIFITALIPIIFGPLLGLLDFNQIALSYGNHNVFLFLGGFLIALAIEKWNVHDQITRRIINIVGSRQRNILLGFILSSAFLSMWISNTSTTLIMLPIALSFLKIIKDKVDYSKFAVLLLLCIAYGANIGGMATLVGSPPNIQMAGLLEQQFGIEISFWDWLKIGLPISLILISILYLYFAIRLKTNNKLDTNGLIKKEPWTNNQRKVILLFLCVVFFWMFRGLIETYIGFQYRDLVPALLGSLLLFAIPSSNKNTPLLSWDDTKELPWGILFLFGGGLALAKILELNGVVTEIMAIIQGLSNLHLIAILIVLVAISVFATEVISNLALVTLFVPITALFAQTLNIDIQSLVIPVALSASCAFMFPISTPPNAIVFSSGEISMGKMMRIGFLMNLFAILVISFLAYMMLF